MRILIVGGAGYIGSVTATLAIEAGHKVTVFDNLSSGLEKNIPSKALFLQGDVTSENDVNSIFQNNSFDAILHFAAKILVPDSMKQPYEYLKVNSFGVLQMAEAATNAGIKHYIISSTAAVYGAPSTNKIDEAITTPPINPYGESKLIAEHILASYEHSRNLNWLALRYFNVAGAYKKIGPDYPFISHIIPALLDKAYKKQVFNINGSDYATPDGTCIRDFVHVVDIARAHINAVEKAFEGTVFCRAINLGSSTGYSVKEIVDSFLNVTKKQLTVTYAARRTGDPDKLVASNQLAKKLLDWEPQKSLKDIITDHTSWYDALPENARVKNIH